MTNRQVLRTRVFIVISIVFLAGCTGAIAPYYSYENKYDTLDLNQISLGKELSKSDYSVISSSGDSNFKQKFCSSIDKIISEEKLITGRSRGNNKCTSSNENDDLFTSEYLIEFSLSEIKSDSTETMAQLWNAASFTFYPGWYHRNYILNVKVKRKGLVLKEYQYKKDLLIIHQLFTALRDVVDINYREKVGEDFFDEMLFDFLTDLQSDAASLLREQ